MYANPVLPKVSPIEYSRDGRPLYEKEVDPAQEGGSLIIPKQQPVGFSQTGLPFFLPKGGKLPVPHGCTASGVLFYSAIAICESGNWKRHAGGCILREKVDGNKSYASDEEQESKQETKGGSVQVEQEAEELYIEADSTFEDAQSEHQSSEKIKLTVLTSGGDQQEGEESTDSNIKFDHTM